MNAKLAATPAINVVEAPSAPATARPLLSVRCPSFPLEKAAFTELAMTIAEQIAGLGRSRSPMGIDVPLKHTGLDTHSLALFQSWLKSAYDYDASMSRLMEDDTTAEVLAADILASPRTRKARTLPMSKQAGSGSFASRRSRKVPRAPISVDVTTGPEEIPITSAAAKQYVSDIGMVPFDSWSSRKSGLMYGLLAMGLVSAPLTPTPSPNPHSVKSPAVPASFSSSMRLRPIGPLDDPRAVMPMRTPIFTSFLDSVRMPGVDYVQSPWKPDHHFGSLNGMLSELRFPQTPVPIGTSV